MIKNLLIIGPVALALCGCGTAGGLFTHDIKVLPVVVQTITTNQVEEILTDEISGATKTNVTATVATVFTTNLVTNVSYTVSTNAAANLGTAQAVNAIVPSPYQPFIAVGLGLLAGVLGIVAKVKNDKAKLLPVIIKGVEAAGNADVKNAIEQSAVKSGQWLELDREVQKNT